MTNDITAGFTLYQSNTSRLLDVPLCSKRCGVLLLHFTVIDRWLLLTSNDVRKRYRALILRMRHNDSGNRHVNALPPEHREVTPYVLLTPTPEDASRIVLEMMMRETATVGQPRYLNSATFSGIRGKESAVYSDADRAAVSEAMRRRWADPAYRQRRAATKFHTVPVEINGVTYDSMAKAAAGVGFASSTVFKRCHSTDPEWSAWRVVRPEYQSLPEAA